MQLYVQGNGGDEFNEACGIGWGILGFSAAQVRGSR